MPMLDKTERQSKIPTSKLPRCLTAAFRPAESQLCSLLNINHAAKKKTPPADAEECVTFLAPAGLPRDPGIDPESQKKTGEAATVHVLTHGSWSDGIYTAGVSDPKIRTWRLLGKSSGPFFALGTPPEPQPQPQPPLPPRNPTPTRTPLPPPKKRGKKPEPEPQPQPGRNLRPSCQTLDVTSWFVFFFILFYQICDFGGPLSRVSFFQGRLKGSVKEKQMRPNRGLPGSTSRPNRPPRACPQRCEGPRCGQWSSMARPVVNLVLREQQQLLAAKTKDTRKAAPPNDTAGLET